MNKRNKTILMCICIYLGIILSLCGIMIDMWQYWVIVLPVITGVLLMDLK
jgi:hypothetical protein